MIRILNAEPENYSPKAGALLRELGELHEEACTRARLLELIPDFDVLIVRLGHRVDRELLSRAGRLRVVLTATTGLNHIDLETCRQRGVEVLCLKGERDFLDTLTATAELTWALLLGLIRRLPAAHEHVLAGGWDRNRFRGRQLQEKTLGILGFGRLGSIVAEYGRAFRMEVLACDPFVSTLPDWVEQVPLPELLGRADVLSLHVDLNKDTERLLGLEAFDRIKPGALLINTSRGELIDESAMLGALESGRLAGAGLDVLDGEAQKHPDWPRNNPVWRYAQTHDNVVFAPHVGGATQESMAQTELFMARKLGRFLRGEL